jgi:hypothetical protein
VASKNTPDTTPVEAEPGLDDLLDDDLFAGLDDLLDSIEEDDAEGWVAKEPGEYVMGELMKIDKTRSDFADDNDPDPYCPTWTIRTREGEKYRVIGFGAVLKREMRDCQVSDNGQRPVQVGDLVAVKYHGDRILRKGRFAGKKYRHFGVSARKGR